MDSSSHISVLLNECIESLNINRDGIYLDGTLGLGGHSLEIAKRLSPKGRLICIDKDSYALKKAGERLSDYSNIITYIHDDYGNISSILNDLGLSKIDGMLFDLGVSSPQLDDISRGFSYMNDTKLDMRMDTDNILTAHYVVNSYTESQLSDILFAYGEEKFAKKIAKSICDYRENKQIDTTFELVDIIKSSLPSYALREKQHPAKRTFQAIRIEVNHELDSLESMMDDAPDYLNVGGRLCVISFHSLEDRIVKNKIKSRENGCTCPKDAPICVCGFQQTLKSVNKKPIVPSDEEIMYNPRARSAKLRVAERV